MSYKYVKNLGKNSSSRSSYGYGPGIDGITVHYWGSTGQEHANVVSWLRGYTGNRGSSAHYVVSDGLVTQIVEDSRASWHGGNNKANGTTIGIEMRPEMTDGDWATLVELCVNIENDHGSMKYYGHKDWKATACPGDYYDRLGELVDAVNAYHKTGKVPSTTGGSSAGGGGSSKTYTVVSATAPLGLYDKDGDGRTRVEDWQTDALGYGEKAADGYFGPDTEDDTRDLQRQLGVTDDGLVGDDTTAAWEKAGKPKLKKASAPKAPKFPLPTGHYFGPKSGPDRSHSGYYNHRDDLREWQAQMLDRGWNGIGEADGLYGPKASKVTKQFQAEKGLSVDALIGDDTWAAAWEEPVT